MRNYGTVTMGGTAPIIIGRTENYGTFRATNTAATYDGIFNNNGAYISTGSSNRFTDLIVGMGGYLVGGTQDSFIINSNFLNNSTQNTLWETDWASLIFENALSKSHEFYLAGLDLGATGNGFLDNFAWGSLSLAAGEKLYLFDGNDTEGAALYLGLITPMDLDNIYSAFNIYYNSMLPGNAWLAGGRYQLSGAGFLIPYGEIEPPGPEPVPEPATMLLLGSGLIGLAGYGRKKFFKK